MHHLSATTHIVGDAFTDPQTVQAMHDTGAAMFAVLLLCGVLAFLPLVASIVRDFTHDHKRRNDQ